MAKGRLISKAEFEEMTSAFKNSVLESETRAISFDKECMSALFGEQMKGGLIVHMARNPEGHNTVVIQSGENYAEFGSICPPNCPPQEE